MRQRRGKMQAHVSREIFHHPLDCRRMIEAALDAVDAVGVDGMGSFAWPGTDERA